jgi:hypothetical protein
VLRRQVLGQAFLGPFAEGDLGDLAMLRGIGRRAETARDPG